MILYTHKSLYAKEVNFKNKFSECIFASVSLNHKDKLLIGLFYRSDNGTHENNAALRKIIDEAAN